MNAPERTVSPFASRVPCGCGHEQGHHVAGRYRCPVVDFDEADEARPCGCPAFAEAKEKADD